MSKELKRIIALTVIFIIEMTIGVAGTVAAASILMPFARAQRGSGGNGGELLLVFVLGFICYYIAHTILFKVIEKKR